MYTKKHELYMDHDFDICYRKIYTLDKNFDLNRCFRSKDVIWVREA